MVAHIISETSYLMKGQGVHTAFIDLIDLLNEKKDVTVVVNGEGTGDIFHAHTYGPYYFWKGRKYKGRRVFTVHVIPDSIKGSLPQWKLWYPLVKWYFKMVYNYADVCIAISPTVEKAIKDLGVTTRIEKIYNPVNVNKWIKTDYKRKYGREFLGFDKNDFVVLGVGQVQQRKGIEDFISIAEEMPEIKFVWVGGRPFGKFTEGIERINNRIAHAPSNIIFPGIVELDRMPEIYSAADVMLFPSYQENCPLAPIEGAANGLPVIFRDIEEYKLLYKRAYLKADNNQEFIKLIKFLHQDQEFYNNASKLSAELILQFEKNNIREKIMNLYNELVDLSRNTLTRAILVRSKK